MDVFVTITALRERALTRHRSVRAWLRAAGVRQSTYYRWLARKTSPNARTLARLEAAANLPAETTQTVGGMT